MKKIKIYISLLLTAIAFAGIQAADEPTQKVSVKGIRVPILTEDYRNEIPVTIGETANPNARGQLVYSVETNCLQFWNGSQWINLCDDEATVFEIDDCDGIKIYGKYYERVPLDEKNYITLPIEVPEGVTGDYKIVATSGNGYFFQAQGSFMEAGTYEIKLQGTGTPIAAQTNALTFICNGTPIGTECNQSVNVTGMPFSYEIDCDGIQVNPIGVFQPKVQFDGSQTITVPAKILGIESANRIEFTTDLQNGVVFTISESGANYAAGQTANLELRMKGTPKIAGTFFYSFQTNGAVKTTCKFAVTFISTLGTFDNPACNCLAIYDENPYASNGEYWLKNCKIGNSATVRTYCDLEDGGWTLVWSISEKTAYEFDSDGNIELAGTYWSVDKNTPRNRLAVGSGTSTAKNSAATPDIAPTAQQKTAAPEDYQIDYTDYRLTVEEWKTLPASGSTSQLKARITEVPTDMRDEWALNNYGILTPAGPMHDPLSNSFYNSNMNSEGKLFGASWNGAPNNNAGSTAPSITDGDSDYKENILILRDGSKFGHRMAVYNTDVYPTQWDWAAGSHTATNVDGTYSLFYISGPTTLNSNHDVEIDVYPDKSDDPADYNKIATRYINNLFGWFGSTYSGGEWQQNHHFGKCEGTGDNDFSIQDCSKMRTDIPSDGTPVRFPADKSKKVGLVPHSINDGEGRYLQWFVK